MDETVMSQEKTFTQADVNAIVSERLKRAEEKYADYESLKERASQADVTLEALNAEKEKAKELATELDAIKKAEEIRTTREKVAKEHNIPADLLTAESEEDCKIQAEKLVAFARPAYPTIKDGGEVTTTASKKSTREQFADWANEAFNN